ncbi:MAG: hypothetical protein HYV14_07735 [Elusimicrobia bacterium]|nr:hypothetical protein [Elusimicrobiota bacterium]
MDIDKRSLRILAAGASAGVGAFFGHRAAGAAGAAAGAFLLVFAAGFLLRFRA